MKSILISSVFVVLLAFSSSIVAQRTTCVTNGNGTDWHTAANWNSCGGSTPTLLWPYDDIIINHPITISSSDVTITGCCNPEKSLLTINDTLTITGRTLNFFGAGDGGALQVNSGGTVISDATISFEASRNSRVESGGTIDAALVKFVNSSSTNIDGTITADSLFFSGDGTLTIEDEGLFEVSTGFQIENSAQFIVNPGGVVNSVNVYHAGGVGADIDGEVNASGLFSNTGSSAITGTGQFSFGTYFCSGDGDVTCSNGDDYPCGDSTISGSPWGLSDCSVVLFADLAYFRASSTGSYALLEWQTLVEMDNSHFVLERSSDLASWETVGEVRSNANQGTSFTPLNYQFIDENQITENITYYRLHSIDFNDVSYNHGVVALIPGADDGVYLFPSLAQDGHFTLTSSSVVSDYAFITISDSRGKQLSSYSFPEWTGVFVHKNPLVSGLYIVQIITDEFRKEFKVVVP